MRYTTVECVVRHSQFRQEEQVLTIIVKARNVTEVMEKLQEKIVEIENRRRAAVHKVLGKLPEERLESYYLESMCAQKKII